MPVIKLGLLLTLTGGVSADAYADKENDANAQLLADQIPDDAPEPFSIGKPDGTNPHNQHTNYYDPQQQQQQQQATPTPNRRKKSQANSAVHTRRRDQSHLLLVGDPGECKWQEP